MKRFKVIQIIGFLALALGVILRAGAGEYSGTGLALLGLLVLAVGRCGAWLVSDQP